MPIVVLSAASDVCDIVLLLELGADDYVTKPFSPRELLARVRTALRHAACTPDEQVVSFDNISVDFKKMEVTYDLTLKVKYWPPAEPTVDDAVPSSAQENELVREAYDTHETRPNV